MSRFILRWLLVFTFHFLLFTLHSSVAQDTSQLASDTSIVTIGDITIIGNKTTKDFIITRELTFSKGDTLTFESFNKKRIRSEENIYNTSLFNSVHLTWLKAPGGITNVYIILKERWYIFPLPVFEIVDRNFNVWWATKDFSRIVYGGVLTWYNFRGRAETVSLGIRSGYTQSVNFSYSIPYINHNRRGGLSFGFAYLRNRQVPFETFYNKLAYYKDPDNFIRRFYDAALQYTYRQSLYKKHYVTADYIYGVVSDTIPALNPEFFSQNKSSQKYVALRYFFRNDHRDIIAYPLKGFEYDFEVVKEGLPFLKDDINFSYITFDYRNYFPLAPRLFFAAGLRGKISDNNHQPYFNTRALGYGIDYIRGYEYYVIDGQHFGLLKTNFKFELLPKHEVHVPFIPLEKFATIPFSFYLNLFGDAGYVVDNEYSKNNQLTNSWQYGYGAGIDFVTYYDIVWRLEYSINKFGESGFFLHFSAPI